MESNALKKSTNKSVTSRFFARTTMIWLIVRIYEVEEAEFQLHSLNLAPGGIGLHVNAGKTEYMCKETSLFEMEVF